MKHKYELLDKNYWNNKFKQDKLLNITSDWILNFENLNPTILKFFNKNDKILFVGCGNSDFSSKLYDMGYIEQTNIDISEIVIYEMQSKNKYRTSQQWDIGDVLNMPYLDNIYDVVFDKSLFDCMLYLDPTIKHSTIQNMLKECTRVLKRSGIFIFITTYSYNKIKHLLNLKCNISVEHYIIKCDNNKNIYKSAKLQIYDSSLNYTNNFEDIYIYICSKL
tara:strand:- start:3075 stop:3734 length:660 start_codon:yes stop_codon:yes gene_type:complete